MRTNRPAGIYGDTLTRTFLTVLAGANTHEAIAEARGLHKNTIHVHLTKLRSAGLITWDPLLRGTIRSRFAVVSPPSKEHSWN